MSNTVSQKNKTAKCKSIIKRKRERIKRKKESKGFIYICLGCFLLIIAGFVYHLNSWTGIALGMVGLFSIAYFYKKYFYKSDSDPVNCF